MKFIFPIAFLLSAIQVFSQAITTDEYKVKATTTDYHLNGNVKELVVSTKDHKGNWSNLPFGDSEFYNQYVLEFNTKRKLIKQTNYLDYRGKLGVYNYVDNLYNSNDQLEKQISTIVNNGEDPLRVASQKSYFYNSNNQLIFLDEIIKGKNSTSKYQSEFVYSNRLEEVITRVDQVKSSSNYYTYNKSGNVVKIETLSFDGKSGLRKYFIYDQNQPIYLEENINNKKNITFYEGGNINSLKVYNSKQELELQLDYNSRNEIIKIKKNSFKNNKSVLDEYIVNYSYDAKENWIKAEITSKNEIKYIVTRVINYY